MALFDGPSKTWPYRHPVASSFLMLALEAVGCTLVVVRAQSTWHGPLSHDVREALWFGVVNYTVLMTMFLARRLLWYRQKVRHDRLFQDWYARSRRPPVL